MRRLLVLTLILLAASPLRAQDAPAADAQQPGGNLSLGQVRSPILTVDPDRLYAESLYGQRITAEVRAQAEAA